MLVLFILLALAGLYRLYLGYRGRRVDDHPVCMKCKFDLVGSPENAPVCSECGSDLNAFEAIQYGNYARRKVPLAIGASLLIFSLFGMGLVTYVHKADVDVRRYMPLSWVSAMATKTHGEAREFYGVMTELLRRAEKATPADAPSWADAIDTALQRQIGPSNNGAEKWCSLLETLHDRGAVPADKWERYLLQSCEASACIRQHVRLGDPIPLKVGYENVRLGFRYNDKINAGSKDVYVHRVVVSAVAGDQATEIARGQYLLYPVRMAVNYLTILVTPEQAGLTRLGANAVKLRVEEWIDEHEGTPGPHRTTDLKLDFELLPVEQDPVQMVANPLLTEDIRKALAIRDLTYNPNTGILRGQLVHSGSTPNLGFEMSASDDKHTYEDSVLCPFDQNLYSSAVNFSISMPGFTGDKVNFNLRGNRLAMAMTIHLYNAWDGELCYENVPVRRLPRLDSPPAGE